MGGAARRGSAPVIDTQWSKHNSQLKAFIHSPRSLSPTPSLLEDQSELSPTVVDLGVKGLFPSQSALQLLQASKVSSPSEPRRLSDTNFRPASEATSENVTLPVPGGRRHSDLSFLSSKQNHFAIPRSHVCQACLSLLQRSQAGSHHCPSIVMPPHHSSHEFRQHPFTGGTVTTPSYSYQRVSSDCSDFSLLQQSLFNIISRKAAPCHTTTTQASVLQSPAVQWAVYSDGDSLKSRSLVGEKESIRDCQDSLCAGEQHGSGAVGVVGHNSRQVVFRFSVGYQLLLH